MKQILMLFACTFSCIILSCQENNFTLNGKVKGMNKGYIILNYINADGNTINDSCLIKKGKLNFKGQISEPTMAHLSAIENTSTNSRVNRATFYLEEGNIKVKGKKNHLDQVLIRGSKTQDESKQLMNAVSQIDKKNEMYADILTDIHKKFLETHPHSFVSASLLSTIRYSWPTDTLEKYFEILNADVKSSFFGTRVSNFIKDVKDNSVGKFAKEFNAMDIDGKAIKLSDFKGKYILLDFWASWCVPCRESTPHLVELFKKYRQHNLDVIAISIDKDKMAWTTAVEKDEMKTWNNILASQDNEEAIKIDEIYFIYSVPTLILIDDNGIIIGRYTGTGEEHLLENKLHEIFL